MKTKNLILFLMTVSTILNLHAQHIGTGSNSFHSIASKANIYDDIISSLTDLF